MCSQLWFLTDRRIREEYPQVQILRALRQRCSEQDVRFRAVFMDQIAVTVIGGHLELGGAPGSLRAVRVGALSWASRSQVSFRPCKPAALSGETPCVRESPSPS
ncbi:Hypothetical predicted protein [Marmota monax]|uniref:Uncharacterized protein n=1 Tax=Marmota monax TaxID=9995 RepID=A0A5E4C9U5_MARMO|nr:hypothetical protein GHT09_003294 [Marmota monax]VTJ77612.1 Hypothetical predicted protein [Marmota monax]